MSLEEYRRHAAECLRIAESVTDTEHRICLIDMAQYWLKLARNAEQNPITEAETV